VHKNKNGLEEEPNVQLAQGVFHKPNGRI